MINEDMKKEFHVQLHHLKHRFPEFIIIYTVMEVLLGPKNHFNVVSNQDRLKSQFQILILS